MSRSGDKSRIAQALREDASGAVRPDVDLWPLIRERVGARRSPGTVPADGSAIVRGQADAAAPRQRNGRKPTLHLSLTAALPVLVLVIAMVGAYLAPSGAFSWLAGNGQQDPCGLVTQQEADAFVGSHLDQVQWEPARTESFACAYNGQNESLNLLVARFSDEEEAQAYLNSRLKSVRPLNPGNMLPEEDKTTSLEGALLGVGDEAYETTVSSQGIIDLYFRHIMARQGSTYFVVTWMTARTDPSSDLITLAQRISERLRSW